MPSQLYEENEIVLVQDRGKLYEAKILKSKQCNHTWKYFVHFQGWNRKFDSWTDEKLVTKKTTGGKLSWNGISAVDTAAKKKSDTEEDEVARKKRKKNLLQSDLLDDETDDVTSLKLQMPLTLKKHMVDEWELIVKGCGRLLKLPRRHTVQSIIRDFLAERAQKIDDAQMSRCRELFDMLQIYFDKALPLILLYRQERGQYECFEKAFHHPSKSFSGSAVYGAEHLLRLFVKLPQLFVSVTAEPADITFMQQKFGELLKFLQKNSSTYMSLQDYEEAAQVMQALEVSADQNGSKYEVAEDVMKQERTEGAEEERIEDPVCGPDSAANAEELMV